MHTKFGQILLIYSQRLSNHSQDIEWNQIVTEQGQGEFIRSSKEIQQRSHDPTYSDSRSMSLFQTTDSLNGNQIKWTLWYIF